MAQSWKGARDHDHRGTFGHPQHALAHRALKEYGDLLLATAAEAGAGIVVSADSDLLAMGAYEGIRLVSPRWFLRWLDGREEL